jgi:hypothetical protein
MRAGLVAFQRSYTLYSYFTFVVQINQRASLRQVDNGVSSALRYVS